MNQIDILYPVFVQALLVFAVGGMMAAARARGLGGLPVFARQQEGAHLRGGAVAQPEPDHLRWGSPANAQVAVILIPSHQDRLMQDAASQTW